MAQEQDISPKAVILLSPETNLTRETDAISENTEQVTRDSGGRIVESHDAVTMAQLRARVEQQSTLISMLKQRNDETFKELSQYRSHYETVLARKKDVDLKLLEEMKARSTLEKRFHCLSSNHDELIKIKDEYKSENRVLREDNKKLRREKEEAFSASLQEMEKQLCVLREAAEKAEERAGVIRGRCLVLEEEVGELERERAEREGVHREEIERGRRQHQAAQQKCTEAEDRLRSTESDLQRVQDDYENSKTSTKDKDDTLKAKAAEVEGLKSDMKILLEEKEKLSRDFERLSVELSCNVQIKRLREQLAEEQQKNGKLQKEFFAYKKHSSNLLQKERDLNSKLRHVSDL